MAKLVYIDETGSSGRSWQNSPYLILVGVVVDETKVQPLAEALKSLGMKHGLGWPIGAFEFHGYEMFHGRGPWEGREPGERIAAYEDVLGLLDVHELGIVHATINRPRLQERYGGAADGNAYRLALQFLLEKVQRSTSGLCIVVADEAKEQELRAIRMVADMQDWGGGEVPGQRLTKIIDSLHFVDSRHSPGVQLADLAAFILGRRRGTPSESHPDAEAAMQRLSQTVWDRTYTWRQEWPPERG